MGMMPDLMQNPLLQKQLQESVPRPDPTDTFMDDLYNQGLLDQLQEAFLQSGQGAGFGGQEYDYLNDSGSPFFQAMSDWVRRQEAGDMMGLIHPQLRGQSGPLPR